LPLATKLLTRPERFGRVFVEFVFQLSAQTGISYLADARAIFDRITLKLH